MTWMGEQGDADLVGNQLGHRPVVAARSSIDT
jgi:hypothetical protein